MSTSLESPGGMGGLRFAPVVDGKHLPTHPFDPAAPAQSADIPVLAEGLAELHPSRRQMIVRRAGEIIAESRHPNLRESTPREKDAFFQRTASVACPNLDDSGACMIYQHRPLVCRTFGLPLRDGKRYLGDVCDLNFKEASDQQRLSAAWDLQWEDALDPEEEYTIPEAIVLIARSRGWL